MFNFIAVHCQLNSLHLQKDLPKMCVACDIGETEEGRGGALIKFGNGKVY